MRQFAPFLVRLGPARVRRALVELTPNKAVQKVKRMSDVMHDTAVGILAGAQAGLQREDAGMGTSPRAKDIISLLRESSSLRIYSHRWLTCARTAYIQYGRTRTRAVRNS